MSPRSAEPSDPSATAPEPVDHRGIAIRAAHGSMHSAAAAVVTLSLGFVRSVLLTRLLAPAHFGTAELALFFSTLAAQWLAFGLDTAIVRQPRLARGFLQTYATLRVGAQVICLVLLVATLTVASPWYPEIPNLTTVAVAFSAIIFLRSLTAIPETLLRRDLHLDVIARLNIASSIVMACIAPLLAWSGFGVWSLVGEQLVGQLTRVVLLRGYSWGPRPGWDRDAVCELWRYGRNVWLDGNLAFLLDRFDKFWVGTILGQQALGFYSRAFEFAGYGHRAVSAPMQSVFFPAFSRLQDDRLRRSQAFYRILSLIVRVSLGLALLLVLTAPEVIGLILGAQWLPMLRTFQLLILYTALDPIVRTTRDLLLAVGKPDLVARTRMIQVCIFLPAAMLLSSLLGIEGAALAVDLSSLTSFCLLLRAAREFADFSVTQLLARPVILFALTLVVVPVVCTTWIDVPSSWRSLIVKILLVGISYGGALLAIEHRRLLAGTRMVLALVRERSAPSA